MNFKKILATGWLSLLVLNSSTTDAGEIKSNRIVPDAEFHSINPIPSAIIDVFSPTIPAVRPKPKIHLPSNPPVIVSHKISTNTKGIASFYCSKLYHSRCTNGYYGGNYAAIRSDLLFLRGKIIQVCARRCIHVRIIDCNCGKHANLIDLYADAFKQLTDLSRGWIKVTISW